MIHNYTKLILLIIFICIIIIPSKVRSEGNSDWIFGGQIQIRSELDGRDFLNETYPYSLTSMRTRMSVEKKVLNQIKLFVELQDSRVWGQEKSTTASIFNVDLHQGFAEIDSIFGLPLSAKAGRYEHSYGSNRFFGSNQWHYASRTFDGLLIKYKLNSFWVDVFNFTHTYFKDFTANYNQNTYPYPPNADTSFSIYGLWANIKPAENLSFDLFSYYETDRRKDELDRKAKDTLFASSRNVNLNRLTSGASINYKLNEFSTLIEGAYQAGTLTKGTKKAGETTVNYFDYDISAYTIAARFQYDLKELSVSLNGEIVSGTEGGDTAKNSNKLRVFDNTYSTKHAIYGYMDYFSTIETSTRNLGLHDYYLRSSYKPKDSPWYAQLDIHYFTSDKKSATDLTDFGTEIDYILRYSIFKNSVIEGGGGFFLPGKLMKEIWTVNPGKSNEKKREDIAFWAYLMLRVTL
ncbi:MAG: alginate export family protein [Candidatus Kapabacteria bacterium]|nr:alginate export family protein [Candidatus Kapabacteria bacterium]